MDNYPDYRHLAARKALEFVHDGMLIGLGSGTTSTIFIRMLGQSLVEGNLHDLTAVPTSKETENLARSIGIPLTNLSLCPQLDLVVDGADEVDPGLNLIKGLGRALLREKIVASYTRHFIVIIDESKLVTRLGLKGPLPVEIVTFEHAAHVRWLNTLGCHAELWLEPDGRAVVTDNGNYLARCWFDEGIDDPLQFARWMADRPGIVEHGLFLNMAEKVVVAGSEEVRILERKE